MFGSFGDSSGRSAGFEPIRGVPYDSIKHGGPFTSIAIYSNGIPSEYGKVRLIRTSGRFGRTFANSVNPDETAPYEPSHQDFHCLLS